MPNGHVAAARPRPRPNVLSGLRVDELLRGLQERLTEIVQVRVRGQMQGPLDAVLAGGVGRDSGRAGVGGHRGRSRWSLCGPSSSRTRTPRSSGSVRTGETTSSRSGRNAVRSSRIWSVALSTVAIRSRAR